MHCMYGEVNGYVQGAFFVVENLFWVMLKLSQVSRVGPAVR